VILKQTPITIMATSIYVFFVLVLLIKIVNFYGIHLINYYSILIC